MLALFISKLIDRNNYRVKAHLRYIRSITNLEIIYRSSLAKLTTYFNIDFIIVKIDIKSILG